MSSARSKLRRDQGDPLEAVFEGALVQEQLGAERAARSRRNARRSISNRSVTAALVRCARARDKRGDGR